jgi:LPS-assembly lipoprotein
MWWRSPVSFGSAGLRAGESQDGLRPAGPVGFADESLELHAKRAEAGATDTFRRMVGMVKRGTFLPLLALLLPLAGCGFQPLYGKNSYDSAILDELASVRVSNLPDRQGQLLRNALVTDLSPKGESGHSRYRLDVRLGLTENQQALRKDDTATRDILTYSVNYYLYEDQTRLATGSFNQVFSYDFLEEHYANISAQDDIRRRAAQSIADEIRNRLAAYFARAAQVKAAQTNAEPAKAESSDKQ